MTADPAAPAIDPTKNVLDLVYAESRYQNAMRDAERLRQDGLRDAESRRLGDLEAQRVRYETVIETMRTERTLLLAEQVERVDAKASERTSKLEQFRWETGGKGMGLTTVGGWVMFAIMAAFAAANYFKP